MAAFGSGAEPGQDLAFRLMSITSVTLFWRHRILDEATEWLREHGYQIIRLDASRWTADSDMHRDVAQALDFPDYYGHNLDALNDCMRDVVDHDYGWSPDATGLVLVFDRYDVYAAHSPRAAHVVLDILADRSRSALLFGHRMMVLVQSDDAQIRFEPVGATPVWWNDAEWLDANRRTP